jgi:hypothetical protein
MSRVHQLILGLVAGLVAIALFAEAQPLPTSSLAASRKNPPKVTSPVDYFRQLLAMSPTAQLNSLTNRSPEARERILAKLDEYQALDPDERELRLRATELRWWLVPMLQASVAERAARLTQVPTNLQQLVESRLAQWTILPPPLQDEILANEKALHYFTLIETNGQPGASAEQQKIASQFNQFFELTPDEKEQTLNTLSEAERAQMQETLKSFEKLPTAQRIICIRNYARFASLTETERAEFLKNAENWSKMSPNERQTWRDLVDNVPLWPPMPPGLDPRAPIPAVEPPMPPTPNVATNSN